MKVDHPLIVFDSGIGGFSILKHLTSVDNPLLYYADQRYFPYGTMSPMDLTQRLVAVANYLSTFNPLAVVIACNTGTVSGLSLFRAVLCCPVFGVEPVVKPLAKYSHPVVWGTKLTTTSSYSLNLKNTYAKHLSFYHPKGLAEAIETDDLTQVRTIIKAARADLGPVDAIGLSCTHYPLITPIITDLFPHTFIYDPAPSVVKHVKSTLQLKSSHTQPDLFYYSTGSVLRLKQQAAKHHL